MRSRVYIATCPQHRRRALPPLRETRCLSCSPSHQIRPRLLSGCHRKTISSNRGEKEMAKVHPNGLPVATTDAAALTLPPDGGGEAPAVLTVWRKSLLLNFEGFTVFDAKGDLVFRVDHYASDGRGVVVLMDAAGEPLFTIRRKKLSLGDRWLVYEGEGAARPRFSVKKHVNLLQAKALAQVTPCAAPGAEAPRAYEVEGSYSRRCCAVYDEGRRGVAEIRAKEGPQGVRFGGDVFRLVVQPGFDPAVAMVIVVLLEQMFGSKGSLIKGY